MRELTTEGMNGGVIFLDIKSSQLIGEKKEWYLSSSWGRETKMSKQPRGSTLGGGTHVVVLDAQPLGAVLLQQPLQQVPACVGHVGLEHRRLVQDVVVHLGGVAAVERRLGTNDG